MAPASTPNAPLTIPREALPPECSLLVGFSGGLDSTVLLHLLASDPALRAAGLRAVHVHHGLHPDADAWAAHCDAVCAALAVPFSLARVTVEPHSGLGLEAAARSARYAAFASTLRANERLVLAHHQDDQAETFLLRALRGSGVDGLAAMAEWRTFAHTWLWRPLLHTPRATLQHYAQQHALHWLEDPSNTSPAFDRNFLRHTVLPLLRQRWPHAEANFARSTALCAQASDLLAADDVLSLATARQDPHTLAVAPLQQLPAPRRARVLRRWIADLALPPLPHQGIAQIERAMRVAATDSSARFDWSGARVQRWRDVLHADVVRAPLAADFQTIWDGCSALMLPTGDQLHLHGAAGFDAPVRVQARRGGERIILPGRTHSHTLKHTLQATGMPPWQRERLPLLFAGDALLAAGDALVSAPMAAWLQAHTARLQWQRVA